MARAAFTPRTATAQPATVPSAKRARRRWFDLTVTWGLTIDLSNR